MSCWCSVTIDLSFSDERGRRITSTTFSGQPNLGKIGDCNDGIDWNKITGSNSCPFDMISGSEGSFGYYPIPISVSTDDNGERTYNFRVLSRGNLRDFELRVVRDRDAVVDWILKIMRYNRFVEGSINFIDSFDDSLIVDIDWDVCKGEIIRTVTFNWKVTSVVGNYDTISNRVQVVTMNNFDQK